jgi:D-alanyl-D-alanine carboxypeptidase/D-alanyl-D-alanine-endopeptidase (penicillin-binding protein 4)
MFRRLVFATLVAGAAAAQAQSPPMSALPQRVTRLAEPPAAAPRPHALASESIAPPSEPRAPLPEPVQRLMEAAGIGADALGLLVLRGHEVVLAHGAERPMQPASVIKLVTTLVGLEQLGPVFRGRTELRAAAPVVKGVLQGDLILRGGADADFSGEALETMLQSLRNQGIRRIGGDLVLDRSVFNPARIDQGLAPFDEWPDAYYNVIPDALLVNKNMLQLDLRSTDKRLRLAMQPALDRVSIESDMTLVDADCANWEAGWQRPQVTRERNGKLRVVLRGTFPRNCAKTNSISVVDRQDYVERLFRARWKALGGAFDGEVVEGVAPADAAVLAAHVARALPELIRDINKTSDNTLARTVFLSLGSLESDPLLGSRALPASSETTLTRADWVVRDWLRRHGIDDTGLVLENGSGLSRLERISAAQLGGVLQAGLRSNWAPELQASLPIAALDGTMRKRLRESPAASHARLKTGSMNQVTAVAGYVPDANGTLCVVVAMLNSEQVGGGKGRAVLDALIDWVAHLER